MSSLVKIAKIAPSASIVYQFLVFFNLDIYKTNIVSIISPCVGGGNVKMNLYTGSSIISYIRRKISADAANLSILKYVYICLKNDVFIAQ